MSGFRTFLKLGELSDGSIKGLFQGGYELEHCNYNFAQGIDEKGETQTRVHGGVIFFTIAQLPSDELIKWSLNSRNYLSGAIILYDANNIPVEKTFFIKAACVHMKINYENIGKSYVSANFVIHAQGMVVGVEKFENEWIF
jgi:hypothetical protein